jgi:hypothetical protein
MKRDVFYSKILKILENFVSHNFDYDAGREFRKSSNLQDINLNMEKKTSSLIFPSSINIVKRKGVGPACAVR